MSLAWRKMRTQKAFGKWQEVLFPSCFKESRKKREDRKDYWVGYHPEWGKVQTDYLDRWSRFPKLTVQSHPAWLPRSALMLKEIFDHLTQEFTVLNKKSRTQWWFPLSLISEWLFIKSIRLCPWATTPHLHRQSCPLKQWPEVNSTHQPAWLLWSLLANMTSSRLWWISFKP